MDGDFKKYKSRLGESDGRVLGLDYGEVRIGLALSDAGRSLASPLSQLVNKSYKELMPEIARIAGENDVGLIAVGLPLEMSGREGPSAANVRKFASEIESYLPDMDIVFIDERLTSRAAEGNLIRDLDMSRAKRRRVIDSHAAAEILQRFLDMMNRE
jgi:putative Holliday junction resolvase